MRMELMLSLDKNSSRKDVLVYSKDFNSRLPFEMKDVEELIENIAALGIDSYSFSIGANTASRTIDKSLIALLETYMINFDDNPEKKSVDYDNAFAAYYLLTYYYRTYEKLEKFSDAIRKYQAYFEEKPLNYALAFQIKARCLRKKGEGEAALDYDRKAVELLKKKGVENIHVNITLAATIAIALENRETYVTDQDINESIESAKKAIMINSEYPKYKYLLAKLQMFSLLYKNDKNELDGIDYSKAIIESKKLLRDAIELEDAKADSYPSSVIEYRSYMRAADLVLSEIRLTDRIKTIQEEQVADIQNRFNENRTSITKELNETKNGFSQSLDKTILDIKESINKESQESHSRIETAQKRVEKELKATQERYLEILGVFVAIVAIIMVVVGTYSAQIALSSIVIATSCMCVGMIGVYSAFLILLREESKIKYWVFLMLSMLVEIVLIAILLDWPIVKNILSIVCS